MQLKEGTRRKGVTPIGNQLRVYPALEHRVKDVALGKEWVKVSGEAIVGVSARCKLSNLVIASGEELHVGIDYFVIEPARWT